MDRRAVVFIWLLASGCEREPAAAGTPPGNYVETIRGTDVTFEMIWVPEAKLWVGKTEVTWDEYEQYCDFDLLEKAPPGVDVVAKPSKPLEQEPYDRTWGRGRRPAVGMSCRAARLYCQWLSINTGKTYRLPTEEEWERACGAAPAGVIDEVAWYEKNSDAKTQEVGKKKPNARGLHDMLGNLWEYCDGGFSADEPDRPVLRGGSWKDGAEALGPTSRLGFDFDWVLRDPNQPRGQWWVPDGDHLGFRVVRGE
jgi:formylglycine-generating enzyme required for sulfatase activity